MSSALEPCFSSCHAMPWSGIHCQMIARSSCGVSKFRAQFENTHLYTKHFGALTQWCLHYSTLQINTYFLTTPCLKKNKQSYFCYNYVKLTPNPTIFGSILLSSNDHSLMSKCCMICKNCHYVLNIHKQYMLFRTNSVYLGV